MIHNTEGREDLPNFELYDHRRNPLDLEDVAAKHPDVVERLKVRLAEWQQMAVAARGAAAHAALLRRPSS